MAKTPHIYGENFLNEKISNDMQSAANLTFLANLKKVQDIFKTHLVFQKTQTFNVLRNLTISIAYYSKFALNW